MLPNIDPVSSNSDKVVLQFISECYFLIQVTFELPSNLNFLFYIHASVDVQCTILGGGVCVCVRVGEVQGGVHACVPRWGASWGMYKTFFIALASCHFNLLVAPASRFMLFLNSKCHAMPTSVLLFSSGSHNLKVGSC